MRVYHAVRGPAISWGPLMIALLLLLATAARASIPGPVTAAAVRERLEAGVRDLFAHPEKLMAVVPLGMPADEERKTLWALSVLFRRCRITELTTAGVTAEGRVGTLVVRVTDVDVIGLRIDEIALTAEDFAVDLAALMRGEVRVCGDARTRMSARVLEEDLNRVSANYQLDLRDGDFAVSGRAGVLFIRAGYRLHGALVATPENQLVFRPKSLSYGILPIPKLVYAAQVRKLNPIFDMARFLGAARSGFDLRFESVDLQDKRASISLSGTIRAHPLPVATLPPLPPRGVHP